MTGYPNYNPQTPQVHEPPEFKDDSSVRERLIHIAADLIYVIRRALIIDIVIIALVLVFCWYTERRTLKEFSVIMQYGALIVLALGGLLMLGTTNVGAGRRVAMGPSAFTGNDLSSRVKNTRSDVAMGLVIIASAILLYLMSMILMMFL